ncbi:hypothetical protein, partial [Protofrankia symbiont of Coriaria myrtifolia]|uniref:hypothetical protein n=1 Tax=Protofrankia symbiont of Coriaria myrtifolia TaxID=1306540 RepID=UPI001A94823D
LAVVWGMQVSRPSPTRDTCIPHTTARTARSARTPGVESQHEHARLAVAGKGWDGQVPVALSEPTVGAEADEADEADGE